MNTDRAKTNLYRHQCEVRYLLAASREQRGGFLMQVIAHAVVASKYKPLPFSCVYRVFNGA